jgi:hypothetical protein
MKHPNVNIIFRKVYKYNVSIAATPQEMIHPKAQEPMTKFKAQKSKC